MGRMCDQRAASPRHDRINVEEYKRPKFQVTLDRPEAAATLNGQGRSRGKADGLYGAAIDGAKVRWRVVREVRFPLVGVVLRRSVPPSTSQEIAHGTTIPGGRQLQVEFIARPDLAVAEKDEPDLPLHGLCRRDRHGRRDPFRRTGVNVGYTALAAAMSAAEWLTDQDAGRNRDSRPPRSTAKARRPT